jgi:hypothetical protein
MLIHVMADPIFNKKFWEEQIRLLSLRKTFEVLEPDLIEINLNELTLT